MSARVVFSVYLMSLATACRTNTQHVDTSTWANELGIPQAIEAEEEAKRNLAALPADS